MTEKQAATTAQAAKAAGYSFEAAHAERDFKVQGLLMPITRAEDVSQELKDATAEYLAVRFKDGIDQQYHDVKPEKRFDNLSVGPLYFLS